MKHHQFKTKTILPVCLLAFSSATIAGDVTTFIKDYRAAVDELKIPALTLPYVQNLKNLGTKAQLAKQQKVFSDYQQRLDKIDLTTLDTCQTIEVASVTNDIELGAWRARLGLAFVDETGPISTDGLYTLKSGKQWYLYFLKAWLGADVSPDKLFAFGQAQLANAVSDYRKVQKQMGFAGNDAGLQKHLEAKQYYLSDHDEVLRRYKSKQKQVADNMGKLFYDNYQIAPTNIIKSEQGRNVPVPGWFERPNKFVYNTFGDKYDVRQMDWLFLHEATPGHHFHVAVRDKKPRCERSQNGPPVFSEGWAAYVETMGKTLGLYQTPEEHLGAIEWDMIRSARVALDVGINYYGWSNDRALSYWKKNVIGQQDKALREINRMRNWPAQVITYKYGADVFERMKRHYLKAHHKTKGEKTDVRQYHDIVLTYGLMPMAAFENLVKNGIF